MSGKIRDRPSAFRIYVLVGVFTLLLLGLMVRLFDIQVLQHRQLAELAERQHQRTIELRGKRGTIYDRRMRELALSVSRESLYVNPNEFPENAETVALLARILGLKETAVLEKIHSDRQFVWLKRKIPPREAAALHSLGIKGLGFVTESQRFYPKQGLAAQVIGFVGTDEAGLEGIEHAHESTLAGEAVRVVLDRDARGRPIALRAATWRELPRGHDLVLTLDERLQFVAERELRAQVAKVGARGGVAIVMEPATGEILALANEPVFDANHFRDYSPKDWRERGTADTFEPGSTLKAIVAAAALEERLVKPDDMFFGEQGSIQVAGVSIRDHEKFGWLTFREVLEKSSNVGTIKVGQRLGKDRLYNHLGRFGFGSRTGIDFPGEAPGLLRQPQQWSELSVASLAIGQELAVTPLQLVTAFSAIANGGVLMRPYLVKSIMNAAEVMQEVTPVQVRRVLSEATARQVTGLLQGVVSRGTGKAAAVEGYTVAGKTGSAQKFDAALGKYSGQKTIASFVGYLPAEHPRVAILVSLDEPQVAMAWGGIAAAPVFSAIAQQAMRYLRVPPEDGQTRVLDRPIARGERQITPPSMVTLRAGNFVENVREMIRSSMDQMAGYVRVHFMSIDAKEARKPRKKAEKAPR
jgi:cell division protein FtsI (penicillin-binding protein 3)